MRKKKKSHLTDFVSLWLFAAIQSEVKFTEQHRENGLVVDIKKGSILCRHVSDQRKVKLKQKTVKLQTLNTSKDHANSRFQFTGHHSLFGETSRHKQKRYNYQQHTSQLPSSASCTYSFYPKQQNYKTQKNPSTFFSISPILSL